MNTTKLTTAARQLCNALNREALTSFGREVGFTERLREVTPHRLAVSLISAMASQRVETIADILRGFNALTGANVQYKPFHNQLAKDEFPRFMEGVFRRLLEKTTLRALEPIPGSVLARFKDIVIQDGSSFAIHDALSQKYPGRFNTNRPAAVELHATMSLFRDQAIRVSMAPDVQGERDFLPTPEELVGQLLLADRGYADIDYCDAVDEVGGSFLIRFPISVNPCVQKCYLGGRSLRKYEGLSLQDVLALVGKRSVDFDVSWPRGGKMVFLRLVVLWNPQTNEHVVLATNLDRGNVDPQTVAKLYRLRWQVELLFKEWKSYANLHSFCTTKAPIAEGLIWASLAAALLKRFLCHAVEFVCSLTTGASTRRAAMALANYLPSLLLTVLRQRGSIYRLRKLLDYLSVNGRRAHPARDRQRGRLQVGLRYAHVAC